MKRFFVATTLVFFLAGLAVAAEPAAPVLEKVARVEGITEYRLDNGLRVLFVPDDSRPTTTINITYLVGSRHEGYGETGMAHLLEHLMFKSSKNYADITEEISRRGGSANGTTWYDRTNYFQTFPAADENLEWAVDMEADRMVNALLKEEDLASEMTVVRNEFEAGENNPFRILWQRTAAVAYEWHGYGRSTIGARSDIENVPIERLRRFYRRYYQPDNAVLVLSGRFDEERAKALISDRFGAVPKPDRSGEMVIWPTYTRDPVKDGERSVVVRRVGDVQMLSVLYHVPAAAHEDFAAAAVLTHILGNEPSGRIYEALVEKELATRVMSMAFPLHEPGFMLLFVELRREQDIEKARRALLETLDAAADEPVTEDELERARASLLRGIEMTLNNSERVGIQLTEWSAAGDWRLLFLHRDRIRDLSVEQVRAVAGRYLKPSNRTVGMFIPESAPDRAEIPEAPEIAALVADYKGEAERVAGEVFEATPSAIDDRTQLFTLDNGLKIALLPKSTRGETVRGSLVLRLGDLASLTGRRIDASAAGAMLMRGTQKRSRQELTDEIARLKSSLNIGGGFIASGSFETTRGNLPAVLDLLAEILQQPAYEETEFHRLRQERLTALENQRSDPQYAAMNAYGRLYNPFPPDHPDYAPSLEEQLEAWDNASLEGAKAFHRDFYGITQGATLVIVGDFDADEVMTQIKSLFGNWKAETSFQRYGRDAVAIEPVRKRIQIDDKPNAILIGGMEMKLRDGHADYPALSFGNHLLGGGFLSSRLARRIRQQEGLSYGVGSGLGSHPIDERTNLQVFAMYAPNNSESLKKALFEELQRIVDEPFSDHEMQTGLEGWLQQQEVMLGNDLMLVGLLGSNLYFGRTLADTQAFIDKVKALNAEDIREAFKRHFDPNKVSIVEAGDFSGAEEE